MIISNPPYVATESEVESIVHDHEPHEALYAGDDGLDDIRVILAGARQWLALDGAMLIEMAPDQTEPASELARAAGFNDVTTGQDFTGRNSLDCGSLKRALGFVTDPPEQSRL